MAEEKISKLLDNMSQIERFFCENCSNRKCTTETLKECTVAFAILAKNTSWGFAIDDLKQDTCEELELVYNSIIS